eukprot:CAMPEP_0196595724 /NCGR_PEP_ID=MMETSP1081-20130531/82121_1 /TAXON_ID=36882 /ORGANISM="Pyramimonas amylifera, Strain CCMP720" /LENGTH=546 /DNA_ID=CAMNT_0041920409 /DNA_START=207 /DNA_END=1848 /DNA_ORIENTATION=-
MGHKCAHESHVLPLLQSLAAEHEHIPEEAHRSVNGHRRQAMEEDPAPLRVFVDPQISNLGSSEFSVVKDRLIPTTVNAMADIVSVKRPVSGPLKLDRFCNLAYPNGNCANVSAPGYCGHAVHNDTYFGDYTLYKREGNSFNFESTTYPGGAGVEAADLVLYVTAVESEACEESLAQGGPCKFDSVTQRPTAGYVNFCPSKLEYNSDLQSWSHWVQVAAHELTHVLSFSRSLFDLYIDDAGEKLGEDNVVKAVPLSDGSSVEMVTTPKVTAAAREHFGCDSLQGAELESAGTDMTAGNHWENRVFEDEVMTGDLSVVRSHVLSNLTLALFEDSGWYVVDYAKASARPFGLGAGCGFTDSKCSTPVDSVYKPYYCDAPDAIACSWDHKSTAYCANFDVEGCGVVTGYLNGDCMDESFITTRTEFWGQSFGESARCIPNGVLDWSKTAGSSVYSKRANGGICLKTRCEADFVSGGWKLFVEVQGKEVQCVDNQVVDVWTSSDDSKWNYASIGPCPASADLCMGSSCMDDVTDEEFANKVCVHVSWATKE